MMMKQKRRWIPVVVGVALGTLWLSRGLAQSSTLELSELRFAGADSQKTITLQFSQPPTAVQSFVLTSPTRLVIDVSGPVGNASPGTIPVQDTLLTRVRTGMHDQRLRVVLDLQTKEAPKFSVQQQQGLVTVVLIAPRNESSKPFSRVLFTLPGRAASAQSEPPVVPPSISASPVQEAKTHVLAALPARPKIEEPAKTDEKLVPTSEQVKRSEKPIVGEKNVAPVEQAKTQEKPSPLLQPSPVGKPDAEEKKSGSAEKLAAPLAPAEPVSVAKKPGPGKPEPGAPEPGEQKPVAAEKAQAPAQDSTDALPPQTAQDHFERGQALYAKGEVAAAMVHWQETLRLAPETAKAHHLLGLALQHRGKVPEAITALQEAVRLTPRDVAAYIHLGQALEAKGDVEAARAAYQKAQQLVPTSAYVYDRLGHLSATQEKWGETIYAWQETVRLRPQSAAAYANLGEALEKVGKQEEALAAYEQALQLDPQTALVAKIRQRVTQLRTAVP